MSVRWVDGKSPVWALEDTDEKTFAYKIEKSGSLTILEMGADSKWVVKGERSVTGFVEVSGTRYTNDTANLEGTDGKVSYNE